MRHQNLIKNSFSIIYESVFFVLIPERFIDIYHTKLKNRSMKTPRPYRKFQYKQEEKIKDLEEHNPRFKRIYSEFENLTGRNMGHRNWR